MVANDGTVKLTNFNMAYALDHFDTDDPVDHGRIRWMSWEAVMEVRINHKFNVNKHEWIGNKVKL